MPLKLISDRQKDWDRLMAKTPENFPWKRIGQITGGGWTLARDEYCGSGEIHRSLSDACFSLAREFLEAAVEMELEVRKQGHPLLTQVRRKRYDASDAPGLVERAEAYRLFGVRLKREGY